MDPYRNDVEGRLHMVEEAVAKLIGEVDRVPRRAWLWRFIDDAPMGLKALSVAIATAAVFGLFVFGIGFAISFGPDEDAEEVRACRALGAKLVINPTGQEFVCVTQDHILTVNPGGTITKVAR